MERTATPPPRGRMGSRRGGRHRLHRRAGIHELPDGDGQLHLHHGADVGHRALARGTRSLAFHLAGTSEYRERPEWILPMRAADLSVVVVSYQVRDLLRRCLASVVSQQDVDAELWVVDNASTDQSPEMVAAEFPGGHVILNRDNVGSGRANNQAMARASGAILLLLNPDAELPPGALAELGDVFRRNPRAGVVGLALVNPDGTPQPWCHSFPGVMNQAIEALGLHRLALRFGYGTPTAAPGPRGGEGPVDWVGGACLAISRRAYEAIGGLEEQQFLYGEEPDLCWRAREAGVQTIGCARVRVTHVGGASGESQRGELFVPELQARLAIPPPHPGAPGAAGAREVLTVGSPLRLTLWHG